MHRSRLCALLIDCKTSDVDEAARLLGKGARPSRGPQPLGKPWQLSDAEKTPPDEPVVQIQRVDHESRVHLDIETDDIPAEVARLEKLGALGDEEYASPCGHAERRVGQASITTPPFRLLRRS